jgi:hypothetical protein
MLASMQTGGNATVKAAWLEDTAQTQRPMELDLRDAVATGALELHYQPAFGHATDLPGQVSRHKLATEPPQSRRPRFGDQSGLP